MSDLRFIWELCEICKQQAAIVEAMAARLAELSIFTFQDELMEVDRKYRCIFGGGLKWKQ